MATNDGLLRWMDEATPEDLNRGVDRMKVAIAALKTHHPWGRLRSDERREKKLVSIKRAMKSALLAKTARLKGSIELAMIQEARSDSYSAEAFVLCGYCREGMVGDDVPLCEFCEEELGGTA